MNPGLNKQFHRFLTETGQMEDKANIVEMISRGRTRSSRELTDIEVRNYIIQGQPVHTPKVETTKKEWQPKGGEVCDRKRKKIIAIFKSLGYSVQNAKDWCSSLKGFQKEFNDYTSEELSKLISIADREKHTIIQKFKL